MEEAYHPSQEVLSKLTGLDVVVVVGPTGAGKTTLINAALACESNLQLILSDMSRAPRSGERAGIDCNFRTREEMLARIARREYVNAVQGLNGGDIYATHPDSFPQTGIGIMPLFADVVPEFRALPFATLKVLYILPPGWEEWQERIRERSFSSEQRRKRLEEAQHSLEFALHEPNVIMIVNDELHTAEAVFLSAARKTSLPKHSQNTQSKARELAAKLLKTLKTDLKNTK